MRLLPITEVHASEPLCVTRVPIFARLEPEQQRVVASMATPVSLAVGEHLHDGGEALGRLFVVHTGRLKVVHTSPAGRERVVRIAEPGDVVGEHAFLTGSRTDDRAEALADSRLCVFAHADLGRLVDRYPGIAVELLRSLSDRVTDAERRLALATVDVGARVATYLLELPFRDGAVRLPLAKKDVASYLGTTPESFSRALARLQRDGLVEVSGDAVRLIDLDGLEAAAAA